MKAFAALLIAIACMLAIPGAAAAAPTTFPVNTVEDEPDTGGLNGVCLTGAGKCSLRAAIEESNASTADDDTITFTSDPFDGKTGDRILLATGLPPITDTVHIDGDSAGQCTTSAGQLGPCAEVNGSTSGSGLVVQADGVEIDGLAVTGATAAGAAGVRAFNGAEGLVLRDSWIGVKLDGTAGANAKGVYLDPDSDGATIGGTAAADRNVISNNEFEGLDIEGASEADVLGNYFGVKPDGTTSAANVGKNIEITDTAAFEATDNEVGTAVTGPALTSTTCDGGCNVIAGSSTLPSPTGVDLEGEDGGNEEPATGPTTVRGNFVGLSADGATVIPNGSYDILVGASGGATIGGEAAGETNFIAGGGHGIYHENGEGFEALGNAIGVNAAESAVTPPSGVGIFVYSPSTVDGPLLEGNLIRMTGGFGIEQKSGSTEILENFIEGGTAGVYTVGLSPAVGNLIRGNFIVESTNGILIEGDENEVLGNEILFASQAGIKVKQAGPPFTVGTIGNLIGGQTEASENLIYESGGDAIEIVNLEGTQNEVARNAGSGNAGLFIDLLAFEPGTEPNGPNGGIDPPAITTAAKTEAVGSAEPDAVVRVFRKATSSPGELHSFLGEVTADESGNWKVAYAAVPGETRIAATQTNEDGGTSELSPIAVTPADPKVDGCPDALPAMCVEPPEPTDVEPPQTKIRKGPKKKSESTTAKFKFKSNEAGSTFRCKLDKKPVKKCKSPKTYKGLKPGKHVFKVWAVDAAGNKDPTPAKWKFKVIE